MGGLRLGVIARADSRGTASQTYEVWRHMQPEKTLLIVPGTDDRGHELSPYRSRQHMFPGAVAYHWRGEADLPAGLWRDFFDGLDAVYTVETPYGLNGYEIAREHKIAFVCHTNPEFFRHGADKGVPTPTEVWAPTTWRIRNLEASGLPVRHVPMPVARDRFTARIRTEPITEFLHIAGHKATRDRNGTVQLFRALRQLPVALNLTIRTQSKLPPVSSGRRARIKVLHEDIDDYWRLYDVGDALVMCRAFGGLCLPINEAAACAMPVIVADREPERSYFGPEACVPTRGYGRALNSQDGPIEVTVADTRALGQKLIELTKDRDLVELLSRRADAYADSISWERLRPVWDAAFVEAVERARS